MTIGAILLAALAFGQAPGDPGPLDDREVEQLIASARQRFDTPTVDREERARFVLDTAARIDLAARAEPAAGRRADRWDRAIELLDAFGSADPGNPLALSIQLQAAVYRWAEGRTWIARLDRSPGDATARAEAVDALDDAIARLRRLWTETRSLRDGDLIAQNIRYRYAQALADRADIEDDPGRALDARQQALGRLRDLPSEPPLAGHAALLKARLLVSLDRLDDAEAALEEAADQPGPTEAERLDIRVALLLARKEFDEAIEVIERGELDRPSKDVRAVRVRARQWIDLFPGRERSRVEEDAIARVRRLRAGDHPEAGAALAALAETILQPDGSDDPGLWELLAEGHLARGDVDQAVRLGQAGADHAEAGGDPERAWVMRYRAAAILVRAGQHARAAEALDPLAALARAADGPAPADQRANASLLHAIALGRLASTPGTAEAARSSYGAALDAHIAAFPDDPTAAEARWTLGQLRSTAGRDADAIALWSAVPAGHPRWREARLAIVEAHRAAIDALVASGRLDEARTRLGAARSSLDAFRDEATEPTDRNAIDLARAELELTPEIGSTAEALDRLDRLVAAEVDAARRDRARRLRIVALALALRTADAEREARAELDRSEPEEIVALATRLDRIAAAADDSARRRIAGIARMLTERVLSRSDALDPAVRSRARVIRIRGQLDTGDLDGARSSAQLWAADLDPSRMSADLLGPLADALDRLGLYHQAADAHRAVVAGHAPGTPPWFEARYGLAVSYYRTDRPADARRLIDGTAALHPDLGGEAIRDKFIRLRRRIDSP